MTTATALRWMTENPAPVCRASHTHFSASISAKLFCRQSLYKRKDGRWEARIIVEYDSNGKAKYKYLYAKTYSEVKAKMICVHSSIESSTTIITNKEASYESWLIRWLQSKKIHVKSSTYIRYRNIIESHIIPALGKYPINRIGTSMMENFVSNKLTHGRLDGNGGLSPKTISDMLTIIKESFKYAQVSGALTVCRFDGICFKQNANGLQTSSNMTSSPGALSLRQIFASFGIWRVTAGNSLILLPARKTGRKTV